MNDIIKDVIVNCLENLMINRIIEKDKKQLEVRKWRILGKNQRKRLYHYQKRRRTKRY